MNPVGIVIGLVAWFVVRCLISGIYTVNQSERAVKTSFGRAERIPGASTLNDPISASLDADEKQRYAYPQVRVIVPGGPYFKLPWQKIYKVSVATQTINMAYDPDSNSANQGGTVVEAVTKDQLNTGLTGQIRYRISERNLYAYLFGVKNPIAHVMGYFVSVLRERIATFEAPPDPSAAATALDNPGALATSAGSSITAASGISINDLRKNLRDLNEHMDSECASSEARYGIKLDASLITGIDPPAEVESALAAINTAHNMVSSDISLAQAAADQRIELSKRAAEIETLKAQAEVQPLTALASQLSDLKRSGPNALRAYVRNVRLGLFSQAQQVVVESKR
ncbi:MAG: SPFH domain-containing protein [Candidatus Angelobacter sp.]